MGTFQVEPENEMQTREWFAAHLSEFEYNIVESQSAFPDYILEDKNGKHLRVEAESKSENFIVHHHPVKGCDLVLCWLHTKNLPLPVLELSTGILHIPGQGAPELSAERREKLQYKKKKEQAKEKKLKKALGRCPEELKRFTQAITDDLKISHQWQQAMTEPRMALFAAQRDLETALRETGGLAILKKWGRLHPYDFFRRMNNL